MKSGQKMRFEDLTLNVSLNYLIVVQMILLEKAGNLRAFFGANKSLILANLQAGYKSCSKLLSREFNLMQVRKFNTNVNIPAVHKPGSFKSLLPDVFVGATHFKRANRAIKYIEPNLTVKNLRDRQRKLTAVTMDMIMKRLTVPITQILAAYSALLHELHPFDATVADLVIRARVKRGLPDLPDIASDLKVLRAETSRISKYYASRGRHATSATEAIELLDEGLRVLRYLYNCVDEEDKKKLPIITNAAYFQSIVDQSGSSFKGKSSHEQNMREFVHKAKALKDLLDLQKELRRIPVVELNTLTAVLVGTPNVGKSSIVRAVSTGTPEVNDYPFTTRSVTVGHIVDANRDLRFQIMDTPGLLDRPADERNEMENLTFAAMAHLPTAVIFVLDPSGLSGEQHSSLDAQLAVRNMLRSRFPNRPWLDVVSKADLQIPPETLARMPSGYMHVSVVNGTNMLELQQHIEVMLLKDQPRWMCSQLMKANAVIE